MDARQQFAAALRDACSNVANVQVTQSFPAARLRLVGPFPPELLVTSERLGEYNGLHLLYLAAHNALPIRAIVYSEKPDLWLRQEVRQLGGFVERTDCIIAAMPNYLGAEPLPPFDRRRWPEEGEAPAPLARRATDHVQSRHVLHRFETHVQKLNKFCESA